MRGFSRRLGGVLLGLLLSGAFLPRAEAAATIAVSAPGGGESWPVGTTQVIKWTPVGTISELAKVELSRDGGQSWELLTQNVKNDGDWSWKVEGPDSAQCQVRVSRIDGSASGLSGSFGVGAGGGGNVAPPTPAGVVKPPPKPPPPPKPTPKPKPPPKPAPTPKSEPAPEPQPPASNGGGSDLGPADGFGGKATGGNQEVRVSSASQLASALNKSGSRVVLAPGEYELTGLKVASNVTFDGGGATIWDTNSSKDSGAGILVEGSNVILRNFRIRNGGDNISLGSSATRSKPGNNVLIERVTSSGSGDDGISISYNAHDVTVRWSLMIGCTRSMFIKYGGNRVTVHHSICSRQWLRGPKCDGDTGSVDWRNNITENWTEWGSRAENGAKGNFVNSVWVMDGWCKGKKTSAIAYCTDGTTSRGNLFRGCSTQGNFSETDCLQAPAINGLVSADQVEGLLRNDQSGAGCMPRDEVDKAYFAVQESCPAGDSRPIGLIIPSANRAGGGRISKVK